MKKSRHTDSEIMATLKQAEAGTPIPELCREHGMSTATFYEWRAKYGGLDTSMMTRLKELELENQRLKKMTLLRLVDSFNHGPAQLGLRFMFRLSTSYQRVYLESQTGIPDLSTTRTQSVH